MTPSERLAELETLSKAAGAAPAETLAKCNALLEERVQERIAKGEAELAARDFVLSRRDPIGSRLYALSCDLTERVAYNRDALRDTN